jgi:serine protease
MNIRRSERPASRRPLGACRHVAALAVIASVLGAAVVARPDPSPTDLTAHLAGPLTPNDPGRAAERAGWTDLQWNFSGPYGVDAPHAWGNLVAAGAPGGEGVVVAVLDTGVALPSRTSGLGGSPDLSRTRSVPGYDFVDNDAVPDDENGHGTHVASTVAEQTNNGYGLTGLAYGVRIMPVRVLDRHGGGDAVAIARGIRFAAHHGAKVINLSLNFSTRVTRDELPQLLAAVEDAHRRGALTVGGAGNTGTRFVTYPALGPHIVAVGATTEHGCLAAYSNYGAGLDLVAPGGGDDADIPGDPRCRGGRHGAPIYQMTLSSRAVGRFDIAGYTGTSMAAPHVSAIAALIIASGALGPDPSPAAVEARLVHTARDLGRRGRDSVYGWGLVDAAAATSLR